MFNIKLLRFLHLKINLWFYRKTTTFAYLGKHPSFLTFIEFDTYILMIFHNSKKEKGSIKKIHSNSKVKNHSFLYLCLSVLYLNFINKHTVKLNSRTYSSHIYVYMKITTFFLTAHNTTHIPIHKSYIHKFSHVVPYSSNEATIVYCLFPLSLQSLIVFSFTHL